MEIPTITGILRKSPEMTRSPEKHNSNHRESITSVVTSQDKGSVRFSDGDIDPSKMNTKLLATPTEKVRFSYDRNAMESTVHEEDDEDYSASVNAIIQRRVSSKRKKRRSSSPFSHEEFSAQSTPQRRSSGFTVTSLETNPSTDESGIREEQIYENIRLHKEVITNVKQQPWPIRRKLKLLQQAKAYVKRHEGELQVRLKQSRSTKDILTRFNILIIKKWQHMKREIINFMNLLIPWELRIKEIESHFGTVVASYFTFLRWLFWVNLVISIILTAFVIVPEVLVNKNRKDDDRKVLLPNEKRVTLDMLLNFEGVLKYSPIFYGYYSNKEEKNEYKIPTAYFMIGIGVYIYSFIAILRKNALIFQLICPHRMAVNFRLSKLSEKEDECIFTWKLFTGWDYMIGNAETGHNRTSSIVLGFKEALLEEAEKKKEKQSWKVISIRVFVNINVIWMLFFSAKTVIYVVNKSSSKDEAINENDSGVTKWWKQNETTVVMTVIGSIFPFIFELFGLIEKYHPRKTLRIQLGRIMALNLLNLYTLTFALFNQIGDMNKELNAIKHSLSNSSGITTTTSPSPTQPVASFFYYEENGSPHFNFDQIGDIFNLVKSQSNIDLTYAPYPTSLQIDTKCENSSCIPDTNGTKKAIEFWRQRYLNDPATARYPKPIPWLQYIKTDHTISKRSEFKSTLEGNEEGTSSTFPTDDDFYNDTASYNGSSSDYFFTDEYTTTEMEFVADNESSASTDYFYSEPYITNSTFTNFEEISTTQRYNITEMSPLVPLFSNTLIPNTTPIFSTTTTTSQNENKFNRSTGYFEMSSTTPRYSIKDPNTTSIQENRTITGEKNVTKTTASTLSRFENLTKPFMTTPTPFTCMPTAVESIDDTQEDYSGRIGMLNETERQRLRRLCWETMFGQELVKLTIMDLAENIMSTFLGDFIRALLVRYLNKIWCWDLEKRFPKYADFKIAENILHLVNNQGLVWMGMFFSPGLPLINVVKLMIMMYLRSWAVLTCNVPHEVVFRASRSNNFYLALLLTMLFLCVLPVCYAIVWLEPSWHCGPFSREKKIYRIFVRSVKGSIHPSLHVLLDYIASPGTVIPLIIVLLLVIYYLASLTSALREANVDLKVQLRRERTEERKKMFQMASRRKRGGSDVDSTFAKWKKILQEVPSTKLSDEIAFPDGPDVTDARKAEDTDVDNGLLKHDEEEKQKIKKIFRTKNKTESASEKKWGTLLRMVPKSQKEHIDKDSTSTTSSLKDDSSMKSENIPEIKISRVQTLENLLKTAEKIKQPVSPKIDERPETPEEIESQFPKARSVLEKLQKKSNLKQIGKSAKLDSDSDEIDDDVFLESVVVEVPEMRKITESISNRIKRRLKKVLSMGSNEENQPTDSNPTRISTTHGTFSEERSDSKHSIDKPIPEPSTTRTTSLSEKEKHILEYRRSKLVKSESMNMERDKKWKNYMQRRKSSLDEIHLHLPNV